MPAHSRLMPESRVPLPPSKLRFMGESDDTFLGLGDELADAVVRHTELGPASRVLDVGCGYGRLAHALLRRGFEGTYLGIDVQKSPLRWCSRHLGSDRFEFRHFDLPNERYNPSGDLSIRNIGLGEREYDVVCAFSLFTHMWPKDVTAYFDLFRKVLADDGRAVTTFFLLDNTWRKLVSEGKTMRFQHVRDNDCRYLSADEPLHAVGYRLEWVIRNAFIAGLLPASPPRFGKWSQRPLEEDEAAFQDTLVFKRA